MRIEVLGFADCPNTPVFLRNVQEAAKRFNGADVVYVDQESLAAGDARRGYPTPTALVGGRDLFGLPEPSAPNMGCRMYEGGVPSPAAIADRLSVVSAQ